MEKLISFQLNERQQYAVKEIRRYIDNPTDLRKFITISGPGGSGKTFMLKQALNIYDPRTVIGSTISHFAKKVLLESLGSNYTVTTIAAFLGIYASIDKETGDLLFKSEESAGIPTRYDKFDIIIVDEASMISDDLFKLILERNKKVIFVGDKYQLPPVGQDHDSLAFDIITAELTEVMRFKGPLYSFSQLFVSEISSYNDGYRINKNILNRKTSRISKIDKTGSGYIYLDDISSVVKMAAEEFKSDMLSIDKCRVVAYRNSVISNINRAIRKILYGKDADEFEVNELIISRGGYGPGINNGDIFRVLRSSPVKGPGNIPCHILKLSSANITYPVYVVSEEGKEIYEEVLEGYRSAAKGSKNWKKYNEFVKAYALFDYSYAVNTHKVQGSTIENVYVMEDEIMSVKPTSAKEKFQSMYVAVTRAKHRVYIYNKKFTATTGFNILENRYKDEST